MPGKEAEMAQTISFNRSRTADIGIFGTGRMGTRLAAMFAKAGRTVVLGSRNPQRAARIVDELRLPHLLSGSYADAATAQAVLPAIFIRDGLFDLLEAHRDSLTGKLLIDISNPFNDDYSDFIVPWDSSGAEELKALFPEVRVVGAFKNVYSAVFDDPLFVGTPSDVFYLGDDAQAKHEFVALTADTPFRYLDAGGLINARAIERMTMITGALGRSLGSYPRMNWRLIG
jgi:predicted dinucleotide-binding enzyme